MTTPRIYLAAVHTGMSTRYEQVGPEDMGAEPWVPEGSGVRVKAMEWREGKHYGAKGRTLFATSIFGAYEVTTGWENGKASAHLSYAETAWLPDEAAAIAFVQGAHDARIRAALEPVAQLEPTPLPPGELLPCPFCGGPVEIARGKEAGAIQCVGTSSCLHTGLLIGFGLADEETAIAAWNRRVSCEPGTAAEGTE